MTKETKIGLLVGLAFIILFAIILSEKGATRGTSAPSALSFADADASGDRSAERARPLDGAGSLSVDSGLSSLGGGEARSDSGAAVAVNPRAPLGQDIPRSNADVEPLPESLVEFLNQSAEDDEADALADSGEDDDGDVSLEEALAGALGEETPAVSEADDDDLGQARATRLADASATRGGNRSATEAASRSGGQSGRAAPANTDSGDRPGPTRPVTIKATHIVESGESLGKIAARYYGRSTPERIRAIFDCNRDVLKRVELVKVDDRLKIPSLEGEVSLFEPAPGFVAADIATRRTASSEGPPRIPVPVTSGEGDGRRARSSGSGAAAPSEAARRGASPAAFTWYEVRKSDTLSRIAKRELGNEKLYLEIYRLNRDVLPNKDMIKPGMKIRIPAMSSSAAERRTIASAGGLDGGGLEP